MKLLLLNLVLFFTVNVAIAQSGLCIKVFFKDGSEVRGTVIEYKKDDYIILEIGTGRNIKFLASEISGVNLCSDLLKEQEILELESDANNNQGQEKTKHRWRFGVNQLTGMGVGKGNSKLLNISPSLKTNFSVSPFLQIGLGIGYSYIQSSENIIILRSGSNHAYPNGTNFLSVGVVNPTVLQTVSSPKSTAYELINSQITLRINYSSQNKPAQFFSEFGLGFGYAPIKDLNIAMESEIQSRAVFGYDPTTGLDYRYYSFQYFSDFSSRYSNALLIELGTGVKFKTIKKQHLELRLSYQNTRGSINYSYTEPYATGKVLSWMQTEKIEIKSKDFLNLSFIAFSVGYSF